MKRSSLCAEAGVATGVVVALVIWLLEGWGGESVTTAATDLGSLGAAAIAAVACVLAARRNDPERRAWLSMAAACVLWALGEAKWSWDEVIMQQDVPFPSIADAAFLAAVPMALAALLSFGRGAGHNRVRTVLDGALVAGSLLFALWALLLGPIWSGGGESTLAQAVNLAYPFTDLAMLTVALILLRWGNVRQRLPLVLVAGALLLMGSTDLLFTYLTNNGSYSSTDVVSVGWIASYLLIALGARALSDSGPRQDDGVDRVEPLASALLPYAALGLAVVVGLGQLFFGGGLDLFLDADVGAIIVVLLLRQGVSLRDNRRLVQRLGVVVQRLNDREAQLEHLAWHDSLTGLANRSRLTSCADEMRSHDSEPPAVIYLDLDGFKAVNDGFGHATGDALLIQAAARLSACIRHDDVLARIGGDEFVVLVPEGFAAATACARRIAETFASGFIIDGERANVTASIGIAVASPGGSVDEAMRLADAAMYAAKRSGAGGVVVYPDVLLCRLTDDQELSDSPA
jgi:diguanylate cyclase (GGDEF)-like protein